MTCIPSECSWNFQIIENSLWINSITAYTSFSVTFENKIYRSFYFNITHSYPEIICYDTDEYARVALTSFEVEAYESREIVCSNTLNGKNNWKAVITSNSYII